MPELPPPGSPPASPSGSGAEGPPTPGAYPPPSYQSTPDYHPPAGNFAPAGHHPPIGTPPQSLSGPFYSTGLTILFTIITLGIWGAIWTYRTPLAEAAWLDGLAGFYFDRLDTRYQEDDEVFGHPRDPFHRVDTHRTSQHIVVRAGGETVAETTRAIALFETGLGVRYYLPEPDVATELLGPSETTSVCPYKGTAGYRSFNVGVQTIADAAWFYEAPFAEASSVAGYLSFDGTGIDIEVTDD